MSLKSASDLALCFLDEHKGENLAPARPLLIECCVAHLTEQHSIPGKRALEATMQALGEIDSRTVRASIDCSRTTSFALFITNHASGMQYAVTIADILDMLELRNRRSDALA